MLDYDGLRNNLNSSYTKLTNGLEKRIKDNERICIIAKNPSVVINNIDRKFEQATKLSSIDVSFLFLAIALQVVRQYLITNFKERLSHDIAAKSTKNFEKNILGTETNKERIDRINKTHRWYHPSIKEVSFNPVPFDQTIGLEGLGGAFEHRAKTPGHDAILGYIIGTSNIATSTLTTWNWQSFHIKYGSNHKPMATNNAETQKVFRNTFERLTKGDSDDKAIIAISLFREAMHIKSDIGSKVSLPIPIISSISPKFAKEVAKYGLDLANINSICKQALYSSSINAIIAMLHRLILENNGGGDPLLYEVRTKKILTYSNIFASASNLLFVTIMSTIGFVSDNPNTIKKAISHLDSGGLLVTIYRILTDSIFIGKAKQEFLEKEFYRVVMGNELNILEE